MKEKKKVKNELKVYDQSFLNKFKRLPSRVEKEPMRNLYMYYKRLKQYITKKQAADRRSGADRISTNVSSELGSAPGSRAASAVSGASGQSGVSLASGLTANSTDSGRAGKNAQIIPGQLTSQEELKGAEGGNRLTAENLAQLRPADKAEFAETQRKLNIHTIPEGTKRLGEIKAERKELRTKLDQFQKNFEAVHNRKIRYTKDIVAVQGEFKRYKDLKNDVAKIEKAIKMMSQNK